LKYAQVPEWAAFYIDYDLLKDLISKTSEDALNLARAYDAVLRLTGVVVDNDINLLQLSSESKFFETLENEVSKAGFEKKAFTSPGADRRNQQNREILPRSTS
jgi:hypothetical protein